MNLTRTEVQQRVRLIGTVIATLLISTQLTGCVVVGGSSRGGWFMWPGGFGLVFLVLLYLFFFRGRR